MICWKLPVTRTFLRTQAEDSVPLSLYQGYKLLEDGRRVYIDCLLSLHVQGVQTNFILNVCGCWQSFVWNYLDSRIALMPAPF